MPITIGALLADRRTISLVIGEDTLNITYRPSGMTPESEERLDTFVREKKVGASLVALLLDVLVEWDLLGEDGKPLAVDAATLKKLPLSFLGLLVSEIGKDLRPNLMSVGGSDAT